jgi:transposase
METQYTYVGLDVHKKTIAWSAKLADGTRVGRGVIAARRSSLAEWMEQLPRPWMGVLEATLFTGWIYDYLKPHAAELKVAHPLMMRAIAASKKKNDRVDADKLADALRANLVPECYMAPEQIREMRRILRFRNLLVRQAVKMKNKCSGLLMEVGAEYDKKRLHRRKYFNELLGNLDPEEVAPSVVKLLKLSRGQIEILRAGEKHLVKQLKNDERLRGRVELLQTIPGVGEILALTWALEAGDPHRFGSIRRAVSYCGLTSAQIESAGKIQRAPLSKQRNKHLQSMLVEAAKIAPNWNERLAQVHERESARGNNNRATLAVARRLVAYLLAVDKSGKPFEMKLMKEL